MKNRKNVLLGSHMSIAGGVEKSISRGESIQSTCIQIFTASNRQWSFKKFTSDEIEAFKESLSISSIECVFSHASYLINLGSPKKDTQEKSIEALVAELTRCHQLGLPYVVLHPGSSLKSDPQECMKLIAQNLDKAIEESAGTTQILLENMAGQGTAVAYRFEQLGSIYQHIQNKDRVGICFDTAHAFAAGYKFDTSQSYEAMWEQFDTFIGLENLKAIHINDSKKPLGSRVDRHEHIGQGEIGLEAFRLLMKDKRFSHIPKVLETPKSEGLKEDRDNMKILLELLDNQRDSIKVYQKKMSGQNRA